MSNLIVAIIPAAQQPNYPNAPVTQFPFLDVMIEEEEAAPFYHHATTYTSGSDVITLTMVDFPTYHTENWNGGKWKKMAVRDDWRNFITFANTEHGELVVYPLYKCTWAVQWEFTGYAIGWGMSDRTTASTLKTDYEEQNSFDSSAYKMTINWANYVSEYRVQ